MLQYHPSNPFRPVNWRWEHARILRENNYRATSHAFKQDSYTNKAYMFQVDLNKCTDDLARWELMTRKPGIYGAYMLYKRGIEEDRHPLRYALEARLLSAQGHESIAKALGITQEVVELYEKIFFNVAEKLDNTDYILNCVIGPSIYAGLNDRDYDLLWKLFGYLYGPVVLDTFITTTSRKFRPETTDEVDAILSEDTRSALQRKVAIVARTYTINPFSQAELLNIYARFLEFEKQTGSDKSQDVILQNIQVMMQSLPFTTGDQKLPHIKAVNALTGNSNAVELRTDEILNAVATDGKPVTEDLSEYKFPEETDAT